MATILEFLVTPKYRLPPLALAFPLDLGSPLALLENHRT